MSLCHMSTKPRHPPTQTRFINKDFTRIHTIIIILDLDLSCGVRRRRRMIKGGISRGLKSKTSSTASRYRYTYARPIDTVEDAELYASPIALYDTIPNTSLSVADFEKFALGRLKALRIIERINLTSVDKYSKDWETAIQKDLLKQNVQEFLTVLFTWSTSDRDDVIRAREFDHISHFLLRLAFAGTEEQRKWFISLELDMFRLRLKSLSAADRQIFLNKTEFPGKLINEDLRNKYRDELNSTFHQFGGDSSKSHSLLKADIYRVPFEMALDLIKSRKVFLRKGEAFVPHNEIIIVICAAFRSHLSEALSMVKKNMHLVQQDDRIIQVIADFDRRHTGKDYSNKKGTDSGIRADELPALAQKSFPLCMKSLYDVVVKDHHLKHFGRLQLGLFIKAIGVPMDESTKFWRGHFTKKSEIDGSRFDKQYLYNIRHMYGHEGKRADYTPYSCIKVITSNVGPGDFHGCPFRHSDQPNLRAKLLDANVPQNGVKEIIDLVEKHHYQIACQKYFEWTHDSMSIEGGVNHPNQYFEESRDVLSGRKTIKAEEKVKTKHVAIYPANHTQKRDILDTQTQSDQPDDADAFAEDMEVDEMEEFLASQGF